VAKAVSPANENARAKPHCGLMPTVESLMLLGLPLFHLGREPMRFLHLFVCVLILLPGAAWSASTNHLLNTNWATSSTQNGFDTARSVDGVAYPRAGSGIGCLSGEDPNCTRGWALYQNGSNTYQDASGVFESLTNLTDSELTMVLSFRYHVRFLFGSFQVQVTNDDRANFANNVANGGQLGSSAARQLGSSAARGPR